MPSVLDWEIAPAERPVGRAEHFDCDRRPVEDLTQNELLGIAHFEAFENKRNALACRKHLRDLIKYHGAKSIDDD
jgi:hypothetical protein